MAIKISNSTIIDDSRNIVNAGVTTLTSVSIGNTQVISSDRQLQNIASLDAVTTATIESAISNAPNTFADITVTGISTLGVTSATSLTAQQLSVSGIATVNTELDVGVGGTIFAALPTGFVGIGTTNPQSVLSVGGTITEFFNGQYWNVVSQADIGIGASQISLNGMLGDMAFQNSTGIEVDRINVGTGGTIITTTSTGLVGIGTINPSSLLTVQGNALVTGIATVNTEFDVGIGGTIFNALPNGRVGIATTNPTTTLQVNGTELIQSDTGSTQSVWTTTQDSQSSLTNVSLLVQPGTAYTGVIGRTYQPVVFSSALTSNIVPLPGPTLYGISNYTNLSLQGLFPVGTVYGFYNAVSRNSITDASTSGANITLVGIRNEITQGVGIASTSAVARFTYGTDTRISILNGAASSNSAVYGNSSTINVGTSANYSASIQNVFGYNNSLVVGATSGTGIGTVTNFYSYYTQPIVRLTGRVTNYYGLYLAAPSVAGTLTNRWSIYSLDAASPMYHEGSIGIGTTNPQARLSIGSVSGFQDTTTGVTTTAATTIDSFSATVFRSARVQVQITQGTNYQASDVLVIHDGTNADLIEYGSIATTDYLGSFTATVSGGNCLLRINMNSGTSATVKVLSQRVTI